jgi:pimeloyl-ACP methyl ester carboxylesterase
MAAQQGGTGRFTRAGARSSERPAARAVRPGRGRGSAGRRLSLAVGCAAVLLASATACAGVSSSVAIQEPAIKPAATDGIPAALVRFYTQKLSWRSCDNTFQCTTLTVPLNYADPTGPTIGLAVIRQPATDQSHRIGSLLLNPGGPGASGVDYVAGGNVVTSAVAARYDLIGFDPRGVARSSPVECLTDPQMDTYVAMDPVPTTPQQVEQTQAENTFFAQQCQAKSGQLLPHIGTPDAARDMDVLRGALGDSKLYYLGKSYGTYLGAVYAEEFPQHVGRMVLDGAMDPSLTGAEMNLQQAAGFQEDAQLFVNDCVQHSDCPLGTDPRAAMAKLQSFLQGLQTHPLPGSDGRTVNQALGTTGVLVTLYDPNSWSYLRNALNQAINQGNGALLLQFADVYNDRGANGKYTDNQDEANIAINCVDHPDTATPAQVESTLPQYEQASPLFGAMLDWGNMTCDNWPAAPTTQPHRIQAAGAPPILVVGTTHDPATPYAWAQSLAKQLESGHLLTFDSSGHTAYDRGASGSTCIDNGVDGYLLNGTLPPAGTVCQPGS